MKRTGMRMTNPFNPDPYPEGHRPQEPPEWWDGEDWDDED